MKRRAGKGELWQKLAKESWNDSGKFLEACPEFLGKEAVELSPSFSFKLPKGFMERAKACSTEDPLLRQFIPLLEEEREQEGFLPDPLDEQRQASQGPFLKKYQGRVLWLVSATCPVHCRYCFRRHLSYGRVGDGSELWLERSIEQLKALLPFDELILSGGDPLMLPDARLESIFSALGALPPLVSLRVHTRTPCSLPSRITESFCQLLSRLKTPVVFVNHINHPDEIDEEVQQAFLRLREAGVRLLNQSVLLKGVNDSAETLIRLSKKLFQYQVMPYYLHLLDRVQGAAHFEVSLPQAKKIAVALHAALPGYLVPKLVREVPGAPGKVPINLEEVMLEYPS